MNIYCTQENLNRGLLLVSHIATKNISLPILNNILIQVKNNIIKISATNLEIGVYCTIRGKVEKEGEIAIQAKLLSDYVNLLPKEKINLFIAHDEGADVLKINSSNSKTKIKGTSASEFPLIPQVEKKDFYQCSAPLLKNALSQVLFATSTSETRPEISGVLFDFLGNQLTLTATDSYRLAEKKILLKTEIKKILEKIGK